MADSLQEIMTDEDYWVPRLNQPDFRNRGRVHDWRNHVPDELREMWPQLTFRERAIIALIADDLADGENWE